MWTNVYCSDENVSNSSFPRYLQHLLTTSNLIKFSSEFLYERPHLISWCHVLTGLFPRQINKVVITRGIRLSFGTTETSVVSWQGWWRLRSLYKDTSLSEPTSVTGKDWETVCFGVFLRRRPVTSYLQGENVESVTSPIFTQTNKKSTNER